ncbi:MAG: glycoside hydrolase family 15 protein [Alphaproteobacteria bacterium]|nr:glycoside hydrolase family 15 protein [Alphaproteobacteria bacterium]
MSAPTPFDLNLSPIGNCSVSALMDGDAQCVWSCAPRVDSPPVFSALLSGGDRTDRTLNGIWAIDVEDCASVTQAYERNTAILRTVKTDVYGSAAEIIDFCPRARLFNRVHRPPAFFRIVRPLSGAPRIRVRLRPVQGWDGAPCDTTVGSNHIRYLRPGGALRLTTNIGVSHIVEERAFRLEAPAAFYFGPDEPFPASIVHDGERMRDETAAYWREWVRTLTVPLEWQQAVIRAAITLKLCAYEETGAIVAALTTSIPESANSGRNWDYRYCWIRDAYYVVRALNQLGAADILENYLGYLRNVVDMANGGHVQPVYGVGFEPKLLETTVNLPGYRGMGPVRVGNQAYEHHQHDVYGQIVLPLSQSFYDERLYHPGTAEDFAALERVGERAFAVHDQPDAGLWEFRTRANVHTYSSLLCWAACDRLAKAAHAMGLADRETHWRARAQTVRASIEAGAWRPALNRYAAAFGGEQADASLLQLAELGYIAADDARFCATVSGVEARLRRGRYMLRYDDPDDFGAPETAFNFCTFWLIEALHACGRVSEARDIFEDMLSRRTSAGLLSEDICTTTNELWGNYPQTYSLVGIISCAARLSRPWSSVR